MQGPPLSMPNGFETLDVYSRLKLRLAESDKLPVTLSFGLIDS